MTTTKPTFRTTDHEARGFGPKYKPLLVVNPAYARTVARDPEATVIRKMGGAGP